jgi:glycosyltransferase involved in cell wall biosynthesis
MMNKKKIILCFSQHYIPGFSAGGPVRSILNFVNKFGNNFDIRIVCSGYQSQNKIYSGIKLNKWNKVGNAKVFYLSNKKQKFKKIYELLRNFEYDLLYLNSFFNFTFSIFPILLNHFKLINLQSLIIAPRGEFSKNAIKIKKLKKNIYIKIAKFLGLYDYISWQASSLFEKKDIERELNIFASNIYIAPDLNQINFFKKKKIYSKRKKLLKLIFLSRISPMKNLDYLLEILNDVSYPVMLSIFGPKEDINYWNKCKKIIRDLPNNITVKVGEEIAPDKVVDVFGQHDLFVFPTRGENFGHVIPECLSAGTPIILSDTTLWSSNKELGIQILSLKDKQKWTKTINEWAKLSKNDMSKRRKSALNYFKKIKRMNEDSVLKNKMLFEYKITCIN